MIRGTFPFRDNLRKFRSNPEDNSSTVVSTKMLSSKIHTLIFVCGTLVACSALKIGVLSNYLYLPSSSSNSYIPYFYSTNCTECLCYARRLSNYSFVLINCMSMGQMCFLYMNYSNNYSFQVNTIGTVYFFQLPNQAVTGTSSQATTERTPTTGTTGKR